MTHPGPSGNPFCLIESLVITPPPVVKHTIERDPRKSSVVFTLRTSDKD